MIKANPSPNGNGFAFNLFGDPYENRTRVTAVKGRCLRPLDQGADISAEAAYLQIHTEYGSGGQIRTNDLPGMNRPL